ncbi:hypothetical protein ACJX0J_003260 [Zea mays]
MAVVSIEEIKEVEKFVDLWLKKKNKKTGVLLNFKGLRRLLGKRQRLLAYLAKKNRILHFDEPRFENHGIIHFMEIKNKNKDMSLSQYGPSTPSMHGVLRLIVTLDGEDVIDCETHIRYYTILALSTMFTEAITVNATEFLENIQIPKRASYIRVINVRIEPTYYTESHFLERVEGVGFISGEEAVNWGLSGPMLRASGIQWDLRKIDPYESYNQFDWKVQWQKEGDSLARYLVRVGEMRESIKIIQQAVEKIPGGPYENLEARRFKKAKNPEWNDFEYRFLGKKPSPNFELSKQELYVRMIVFSPGDGKIRPPGFINLQILPQLVKKMKLADIMTILGSIDIIMGEVDR